MLGKRNNASMHTIFGGVNLMIPPAPIFDIAVEVHVIFPQYFFRFPFNQNNLSFVMVRILYYAVLCNPKQYVYVNVHL